MPYMMTTKRASVTSWKRVLSCLWSIWSICRSRRHSRNRQQAVRGRLMCGCSTRIRGKRRIASTPPSCFPARMARAIRYLHRPRSVHAMAQERMCPSLYSTPPVMSCAIRTWSKPGGAATRCVERFACPRSDTNSYTFTSRTMINRKTAPLASPQKLFQRQRRHWPMITCLLFLQTITIGFSSVKGRCIWKQKL